ncbi:long-chain-acyl-CoA dehydrogenase [Alicycliphilus sp. B1]|nr:long-chain-acyl-CoA dehydrogenase [Alicycliphilus sp. B1]
MFGAEHALYRASVARFIANEITPHHAEWEREGRVPRQLWRDAGAAGLLCPSIADAYGGGGGDYLYSAIVVEEIARALATGVTGFTTHSENVAPYLLEFGSEAQKREFLPKMASGEVVGSLAMTEPGAGSDLKAIRTTAKAVDGGFEITGQKTFITNGAHADRVIVFAKTSPEAGARGISLFWVDTKTPGFAVGRVLDKIGQLAQDTAELFFDKVFVPRDALIGELNAGFGYAMSGLVRERLLIALRCAVALEVALDWTIDYVKQRQAFGHALIDNQYIRFRLADIKTHAAATRAFVDSCLAQYLQGQLTADGAAMAKLWASEATRAIDDLMQFFGGNGYMREYPIARAYADVRPNRIYGGSSEIMREVIARGL